VKTLVSVSEADIRIAALADITVVTGEPAQFQIAVPAGYEITAPLEHRSNPANSSPAS